jgi:hypothetical protein
MLVVSSMVHPARGLKSAAFGVAGSAFSSVVVPVVTPMAIDKIDKKERRDNEIVRICWL